MELTAKSDAKAWIVQLEEDEPKLKKDLSWTHLMLVERLKREKSNTKSFIK
jgi:hypothetical protein